MTKTFHIGIDVSSTAIGIAAIQECSDGPELFRFIRIVDDGPGKTYRATGKGREERMNILIRLYRSKINELIHDIEDAIPARYLADSTIYMVLETPGAGGGGRGRNAAAAGTLGRMVGRCEEATGWIADKHDVPSVVETVSSGVWMRCAIKGNATVTKQHRADWLMTRWPDEYVAAGDSGFDVADAAGLALRSMDRPIPHPDSAAWYAEKQRAAAEKAAKKAAAKSGRH